MYLSHYKWEKKRNWANEWECSQNELESQSNKPCGERRSLHFYELFLRSKKMGKHSNGVDNNVFNFPILNQTRDHDDSLTIRELPSKMKSEMLREIAKKTASDWTLPKPPHK